jgi:hypothetical protein
MAELPDIAKSEAAIVELTNVFRASEKLGRVKQNAELNAAAKLFAEYLAKTGRFAHEADGRKPADRARAAGYRFCSLSENLASNLDSRGFTSKGLAELAVEGWKNSPGHRRNMVEPGVTEIGVGVAKAPDLNPKYVSVQLFGRPESLRYKFKIENRSGATVTYNALGESSTIEPRVIATHTVCDEGEIVFERAGSWLTGVALGARFKTRDGAHYVVTSGADGRVRVDLQAPTR